MPIINLINIAQLYDYSFFEDIVYPTGLDKDVLIASIMDFCGLYEPIHTEEDILKLKVQYFFRKNELTYKRLYDVYTATYAILDNTDKTEEITVTHTSNRQNENTGSLSGVNKVAPFDSDDFANDSSNSTSSANKDKETVTESTTTSTRAHGNIGVTTSQQMLTSELEMRPKLNLYEIIARDFYNEFMMMNA